LIGPERVNDFETRARFAFTVAPQALLRFEVAD
jgi:hypothetical protein